MEESKEYRSDIGYGKEEMRWILEREKRTGKSKGEIISELIQRETTKVGIEAMKIALPKHYIETEELAIARGVEPEKFTKGLGIEKIAICYEEDVVDLGARALQSLLVKTGIAPSEISQVLVATESAPDESKPLGTNIFGRVQNFGYDFSHAGTVEYKFACIAGAYALMDAWNRVKLRPEEKIVVICVDEAKYDLKSPGEPTSGGGAVAMLIGATNPMVSLDFSIVGLYTSDINDFNRPFGKKTPFVDGKLSEYAYYVSMRQAHDDYNRKVETKEPIVSRMDRLLFHVPYPKITSHALSYLLRHEYRGTDEWQEIIKGIEYAEPETGDLQSAFSKEFREKDKQFRKALMGTKWFKDIFHKKVSHSLIASSQTGNLYTGSLWLALASLLEYGDVEQGEQIGFGSYGSGAGAMAFPGKVEQAIGIGTIGLSEEIVNRERISIAEYEACRNKT